MQDGADHRTDFPVAPGDRLRGVGGVPTSACASGRETLVSPLLLLDVDGVLNALGTALPGPPGNWRRGVARAEGNLWPITFSPEVVTALRSMHEQGTVEVAWLTTWGSAANEELRALVGLPHLRVAGTYHDEPDDDAATAEPATDGSVTGAPADAPPDDAGLAAVTPSAPDPLTGAWWKYDVVRRVRREQPGRPVVWVDDELTDDSAFTAWARRQPDLLAVGPDPRRGLTVQELSRIRDWVLAGGPHID